MTRIIAGLAKGRRIAVPDGGRTRPTSDRAREGIFSTVESITGGLAGTRFLDLYAGSGAVGLEALSRGAAEVLLVESDRAAARTARENLALLDRAGVTGAAAGGRIATDRAERLAATLRADQPGAGGPYDVAFLDPPYVLPNADLGAVLSDLAANGWLTADGLVVVERATRSGTWPWPAGFRADRSRAYGEGTVWYGRRAG